MDQNSTTVVHLRFQSIAALPVDAGSAFLISITFVDCANHRTIILQSPMSPCRGGLPGYRSQDASLRLGPEDTIFLERRTLRNTMCAASGQGP